MRKTFRTFVFPETTKKQIDSMPTGEMQLKFYKIVTDYGTYGVEPTDLNEMELLIWIPMQDLIDSSKTSRGGAPVGNKNAKTTKTTKNNQNNQNNQNNVVFDETTETTLNNGNGNGNGNGNHNVNHNGNGNGNGKGNENQPTDRIPSPTYEEVRQFFEENGLKKADPVKFFAYYEKQDWETVTDWKETAIRWNENEYSKPKAQSETDQIPYDKD